jgi:hypothetical protein
MPGILAFVYDESVTPLLTGAFQALHEISEGKLIAERLFFGGKKCRLQTKGCQCEIEINAAAVAQNCRFCPFATGRPKIRCLCCGLPYPAIVRYIASSRCPNARAHAGQGPQGKSEDQPHAKQIAHDRLDGLWPDLRAVVMWA